MGILGKVVIIGYSLCFVIEENNLFTDKRVTRRKKCSDNSSYQLNSNQNDCHNLEKKH